MKITGSTAAEIYECIRAGVQAGSLVPGQSLPPVRELGEELGVNRNTVAAAYQRLVKAGIALTQGRHGTSICEKPEAGEQEGRSTDSALFDLADGNPDPEALIDVSEYLGSKWPRPYLYGDETVLRELRHWGEQWLKPDCPSSAEVELTNGAVDAIERLAVAHLVAGDKVAVEQPCFLGTINALRLSGMQAVGVAIDDEGMIPEALADALQAGARAVLITPRAHNPTGCSLSKKRAAAIKEILGNYPHVLIIVDDHFALLAESDYHSVIPATSNTWALIRSLSKALGPDLRTAFIACDPQTGERLRTRLAPGMTWVSHILQTIILRCLTSEATRGTVKEVGQRYGRNRQKLRELLNSEGIDSFKASDGFNVWISISGDPKDLALELAKRGWLVRVGSAYTVTESPNAIRVTVSRLTDDLAKAFVKDLRTCL